jgi:hypothetical protein
MLDRYGDSVPTSDADKLFTIFYITFGLSVIYAVSNYRRLINGLSGAIHFTFCILMCVLVRVCRTLLGSCSRNWRKMQPRGRNTQLAAL